ncbi:MAG: efflux RND transporter periplasmic adaptor subunit [Magnetospiraceae bacterium]
MSIAKQILVTCLLLLVLGGGSYFYFQTDSTGTESPGDRKSRAITVEVAPVRPGPVRDQVEAVGTTLARQAVDIVPLESGRIIEITFLPGQRVSAGDILVRLDDGAEQATVDEAVATAREAELALTRTQKLRESRTVAQATLETMEADLSTATARLALARQRLENRVVRAPFDGVVGLRQVHLGARVDDNTVITTLDDLSEVEIDFSVPEDHFGRIRVGQPVVATTSVFKDRAFTGTIASIDTRIQEVSRAFRVRAVVPNPEQVLPAGMFMHVAVLVAEEQALLIPEEAVIVEGDDTFVFALDGDRATRRMVVLGPRLGGQVAILEGLEPGQQVVRAGHQRLRDGAAVSIKGAQREKKNPATEAGGT